MTFLFIDFSVLCLLMKCEPLALVKKKQWYCISLDRGVFFRFVDGDKQ